MYLKALEMRGFKSFPDKTRLEFQKGITAVVGPNGSGKSNISDAVRWVLGEMSPKSLRGSKMEDVIFAGTAKRPQTGFCEVSIIVDNASHELANDAEEVKITRKYFRSGDSEYRINDKPSRLKDIYELFLNTGIGREGYSVVGQGKIAEVLSQKSDERRHIFEEAAGISKFRYRKTDAEKKLAETDANLVRLTDIVGEIESRLGPLEKDAENAKKYLVLADRKKELEVAIWLDSIEKADEKAKVLEGEHAESKTLYENAAHESELLAAAIEGLFNKKQFYAEKAEETRETIAALEEEKNRLDNLCSLSENDVSHHNDRLKALDAEISLLAGSEAARLAGEADEAQKALQDADKAVADANTALNDAEKAAAKADADYADAESRIEEKDAELRRQNDAVTELKIEEAAVQTSEKSETEQKEFLSAELAKATEELEQTYKYHEAASKRKVDAESEKKQIAADLAEEKTAYDALIAARDELAAKKNEYAAAYAANTHRKDALAKMDALLEGYPGSVKAVMNEKSLTGICGPVSRLLTASGEYVTAIETALGAAVSNIVVEDEDAAKAAIRFLKSANAGRATFLPLTSVSGRTVAEQGLATLRGFVGIASELVTFDKRYAVIAETLLGRTIVVDDMDNASFIARRFNFRYKVVTLDGQVINAGGSYTGGSAAVRSGVMSRGTDMAALDAAIADILKKAKALNEKIAENKEAIENSEEFLESLRNDLASADAALYRAENDRKLHEEHVQSCSARIASLQSQMDEFDEGKQKEKLFAVSAKRLEAETALESLTLARKELDALADALYEAKNKAAAAVGDCRLALIAAEKDREAAFGAKNAAASRIADNAKRVSALGEEKKVIEGLLAGIADDIEKHKTERDETAAKLAAEKETLAAQLADATDAEAAMTRKREKEKEVSRDKETYFEQMTRLSSTLENCRAEYDAVTAKLFEEYQLTYSEALELKLPPPEHGSKAELASVKNKIRALGHINVGAVEEYKETKERFDFMSGQISDLTSAKKSLENVIGQLERDMKKMFEEAIVKIGAAFKRTFAELFGGGSAEIVIVDPDNMLESGIDLNVQPPGKTVKNISLLSGGEQAFTAIALYFAILEINPAPFYIFDEIEAALDDVNVARFAAYVKKNADTQFIIITHRRGTMEVADTMYGVTMQEKGVSSFLKVNIDDVEKKTGVKL